LAIVAFLSSLDGRQLAVQAVSRTTPQGDRDRDT
jgi:hypothetical protein